VQAVVHQQHGLGGRDVTAAADELRRVGEPDHVVLQRDGQPVGVHGVRRRVGVRAARQREVLVEQRPPAGDDLVAPHGVVAVAGREVALPGHDVGAVERVVERPPAGVRGVGGEPGVQQRDDQLRPGDPGHLVVDVGGADLEVGRLVEQVADLGEERRVRLRVGDPGVLPVELVDAGLQLVATGEQLAVARREVVDGRVHPVPERLRVHARGGQGLLDDEAMEARGDAEPPDLNALIHATPLPGISYCGSVPLHHGN
jgi:hypothetical protein